MDTYRFTVTTLDDPRLADLKKETRTWNREHPHGTLRKHPWATIFMKRRVLVKARLGPNRKGLVPDDVYRKAMNGSCPMEYGSYFDVYLTDEAVRSKEDNADRYSPQPITTPPPSNYVTVLREKYYALLKDSEDLHQLRAILNRTVT